MSALGTVSGTGYPSVKFQAVGDNVAGRIVAFEDYQEKEFEDDKKRGVSKGDLAFYPSGDPIMGVMVHLETDPGDEASRVTLWVKGKLLSKAVAAAFRKAGATDLEIGADLAVTFTGYDGRAKTYSSAYARPDADAASSEDPWASKEEPAF